MNQSPLVIALFTASVATLASSSAANAQPVWRTVVEHTHAYDDQAIAFDPIRGYAVAFGGFPTFHDDYGFSSQTSLFEDGVWSTRPRSIAPRRIGHDAAYVPSRNAVLIFGGWSQGLLNDTWAWNGYEWNQLDLANPPSPRERHTMAFDESRNQLVVYGGDTSTSTFTLQGNTWTEHEISASIPLQDAVMAYDSAKQRLILTGGQDPVTSKYNRVTWTWDGAHWEELALEDTAPAGPYPGAMGFDPISQRLLLINNRRSTNHTWSLEDSGWALLQDTSTPDMGRPDAYLDLSTNRLVLSAPMPYTWDGSRWIEFDQPALPRITDEMAMATDTLRSQVVLFGLGAFEQLWQNEQTNQTWTWDGFTWTQHAVLGPSCRVSHSMAFDEARGLTILTGGYHMAQPLGGWEDPYIPTSLHGTWAWDGQAWSRLASMPSPRAEHASAFDSAREELIVFGGGEDSFVSAFYSPETPMFQDLSADTLAWDGEQWSVVASTGPEPRTNHAMVYDRASQEIVLFGGRRAEEEFLSDTWTWDGESWTHHDVDGPPALADHTLIYDAKRHRVLLYGGTSKYLSESSNETWEWDGEQWSRLELTTNTQLPRYSHAAAIDPTTDSPVMFGGTSTFSYLDGIFIRQQPTIMTDTVRLACSIADYNADNILDNADITLFIRAFLSQNPAADTNGDQVLDMGDIMAFIESFFAGC